MNTSAPLVMPDFCSRRHPVHINTALMILMKMGIDLEQVDILAQGEHENYRGEIREQRPKPGETFGPHDNIMLKVGCFSVVDQLPYQFFYGLDSHTATRTGDWENSGRQLMAPFDASVIRRLAQTDFEELQYLHNFADLEHIDRFLRLFGLDVGLTTKDMREALLWSAMMPAFNEWAGNPRQVEHALECLFGYKFSIVENEKMEYEIPSHLQYRLGSESDHLGRETVLGSSFSECDSGFTVYMKQVAPEDMRRFLPGQSGRRRLEKILDICMPSHFCYEIKITPRNKKAALSHESTGAYLGYSSYA